MFRLSLRSSTTLLLLACSWHRQVWAADEEALASPVEAIPELSFQAPESCPTRSNLEGRVQELLGEPLDQYTPPQIDIRITEAEAPPFVVVIRVALGSGDGIREFGANTCGELVEATALMVAILLNPDLELDSEALPSVGVFPLHNDLASRDDPEAPEPSTPESSPAAPKNAKVRPVKEDTRAPSGARNAQLVAFFSAYGLLDIGTLGSIAPGVAIEGGLNLNQAWILRLGASFLPNQLVTTEDVSGDFWLLAGNVRLCRRVFLSSAAFSFCGGLEAGTLHGVAVEEAPRPKFGLWLAPLLGLDGALPLGGERSNWAAFARFEGLLPVIRDEFRVRDITVHQSPIVVARLGVGVRLHF